MNPPIYIISRGRADYSGHFGHYLNKIGVPYSVVIEEDEHDAYTQTFGADRLLVLDQSYKTSYNYCDDRDPRGSGPARNWVWDHAESQGHDWYWLFDDNIKALQRRFANADRRLAGPEWFEPFHSVASQVRNVGMTGPIYYTFRPFTSVMPPISIAHLMSGFLIRTELGIRWECRYNEDIDLSIRMAKSGWLPVRLNNLLIHKAATQSVPGGNTSDLYTYGTSAKTSQLVARHPQYVKATKRYGRPHHQIDWPGLIADYNLAYVT